MPKAKGMHGECKLSPAFVYSVTKPGFYADGHCLYLNVRESGAKSWVQRIYVNGKRQDLGLGSLKMVGLVEARRIAFNNRKMLRIGQKPMYLNKEQDT